MSFLPSALNPSSSSLASSCPHLNTIREPTPSTPIYRDECTQCFDNDEDNAGINICLICYNGGCPTHSIRHSVVSGHSIVLNIYKKEIPPVEEEIDVSKITKLAIGVEGGIPNLSSTYDYYSRIYCNTCKIEIDKNNDEKLKKIINDVLKRDSALKTTVEEVADAWGGGEKKVCDHGLFLEQYQQLSPIIIDKTTAKCNDCDLKDCGLWLCLTCGNLGCPRNQQISAGVFTGGSAHAKAHYEKTKHPLVMKVGTLTPDGKADVFCYECDDTIIDQLLSQHLLTFGIDIKSAVKTEKTTDELDLDLNITRNWSSVYDPDGSEATLLFGSGYTGLKNLGNSCYMASCLQLLFSLPFFQKRYYADGMDHLLTCRNNRPAECFACQMAKLGHGLLSGKYAPQPSKEELLQYEEQRRKNNEEKGKLIGKNEMDIDNKIPSMSDMAPPEAAMKDKSENDSKKRKKPLQPGIPPRMLKKLIAKNHPEFSTARQQDAMEYFQYLLGQIVQKEHIHNIDPSELFNFRIEDRIECSECHGVRYRSSKTTELSLPVPADPKAIEILEKYKIEERKRRELKNQLKKEGKDAEAAALDKNNKLEEPPIPSVAFDNCLSEWSAISSVDDYYCAGCGKKTRALKRQRFESFPDVLMVQMRRFVYLNGEPSKLDVDILLPESDALELDALRGTGLIAGEKALPDDKGSNNNHNKPTPKPEIVSQLMEMGFGENAAKRAALSVNNSNNDDAMNWLLGHLDDANINDPLPIDNPPSSSSGSGNSDVPDDLLMQLESMGFPKNRCVYALKQTSLNVERAVEWLFSHMDEDIPDTSAAASSSSSSSIDTKPARYRLVGFINHLGRNAASGHYVCHLMKEGRWVQYNDEKVFIAKQPPKGSAYLYLYRRV